VFEITEFMMVGIVFLSMAYTYSKKGHVAVDVVVMRFPKRVQNVINVVNYLISFFVLALMTWKGFMRGLEIMAFHEVSATLHIPSFPFVFLVALGCGAMAIEILVDTIKLVMGLDSL
jgi:TRAP-type C4-dicarboxylate transport system permease small subunit